MQQPPFILDSKLCVRRCLKNYQHTFIANSFGTVSCNTMAQFTINRIMQCVIAESEKRPYKKPYAPKTPICGSLKLVAQL